MRSFCVGLMFLLEKWQHCYINLCFVPVRNQHLFNTISEPAEACVCSMKDAAGSKFTSWINRRICRQQHMQHIVHAGESYIYWVSRTTHLQRLLSNLCSISSRTVTPSQEAATREPTTTIATSLPHHVGHTYLYLHSELLLHYYS